jgi:predicted RNase H-like nuclease (RuvC/YqgF family)
MSKPRREKGMGMKITVNKKIIAIVVTTLSLAVVFINASADGTIPGSEADPVVTQSYVELKSEQTKYYIDSLIEKNNQDIANLKTQLEQKNQEILKLQETVSQLSTDGGGFAVVMLNKGKVLLTGSGAEVIVRSGNVTAITGTNGALADITSAKDLSTGGTVVLNHLLISSRDDGRGIKASSDSYLIIRGAYTIK